MENLAVYLSQNPVVSFSPAQGSERRKIDLTHNMKLGIKVTPLMLEKKLPVPFARYLDPLWAHTQLDAYYESLVPGWDGKTSLEKCRTAPRDTRPHKIMAEVYRILRVYRLCLVHKKGEVVVGWDRLDVKLVNEPHSYGFQIFPVGLELICSAVWYFLESQGRPESLAYVEAALLSYYRDALDQIRDFHDEDWDVAVFQNRLGFHRHLRYICGNASFHIADEKLVFDVDDFHRNPQVYPMDFYVEYDQQLHIIPVEALTDYTLPVAELSQWKARSTQEENHG